MLRGGGVVVKLWVAECSHFDTRKKELKKEAVHGVDKFLVSTLSRAVCFMVMSIYSAQAPVSPVAINLSHLCFLGSHTDNFTDAIDFTVLNRTSS